MSRVSYLYSSFMVLAVCYLLEISTMGIGTPADPKAGFYPLAIGIAMLASSGFLFIRSIRAKDSHDPAGETGGRSKLKVAAFFALLFGYAFFLESVGFILCSLVFVSALLYLLEWRLWWKNLITTVIISASCQFIFANVLDIPVPGGILSGLLGV